MDELVANAVPSRLLKCFALPVIECNIISGLALEADAYVFFGMAPCSVYCVLDFGALSVNESILVKYCNKNYN